MALRKKTIIRVITIELMHELNLQFNMGIWLGIISTDKYSYMTYDTYDMTYMTKR